MTKKIAVIDCGTNTFHLLIANKTIGKIEFVLKKKRVVKLAEKNPSVQFISKEATQRATQALSFFKDIVTEHQLDINHIYCVGTSAIRDAQNQTDFIKHIQKNTGILIHPISGDEEALLIFNGIKEEKLHIHECVLIMDIGGGSVEFVIAKENDVLWKESFPLGAARIINMFKPTFPLSFHKAEELVEFISINLSTLIKAIQRFNPSVLIGSSGAFDSLISIRNKTINNQKSSGLRNKITLLDFNRIYQQIMRLDYSSLLKMPGLIRMRSKMIVPSVMLIKFVIETMEQPKFLVSKYALKEGLAFKILNT